MVLSRNELLGAVRDRPRFKGHQANPLRLRGNRLGSAEYPNIGQFAADLCFEACYCSFEVSRTKRAVVIQGCGSPKYLVSWPRAEGSRFRDLNIAVFDKTLGLFARFCSALTDRSP